MWQRFTNCARHVIFHAQQEAKRLDGNWVCTEHLLLSLIKEEGSVAVQVLERCGISCEQVRDEIGKSALRAGGQADKDARLTVRAKSVLDFAFEEARDLGSYFIGTEHLLLGLLREASAWRAGR